MKNKVFLVGMMAMSLLPGIAVADTLDHVDIVDGPHKWRFVAVDGTSRLPLEFMSTGENKERLTAVSFPRFWISESMVTEGDFAMVMGKNVREGKSAAAPLSDIEWEEALSFCSRFTDKYLTQLPTNTFASMPTMFEWAHAVKVLEGKVDLSGDVGTFLFTMNQFAGVLATSGTFESQRNADFDLAVDLGIVPKRVRQSFTGLRLVLVSWDGGLATIGDEQVETSVVSRGSLLTTYGLWTEAKKHLHRAIDKGRLLPEDLSRARRMLEFMEQEHDHYYEDWSGLVSRAAAFAEKLGYSTHPYVDSWQWLEYDGGQERPKIASEYGKAGVVGEWVKIGDLPETIRKDQYVGEEGHILIFMDDDEKPFNYSYTVTESNLVQVLKCDFTGDGKKDMVVEDFLSVGSGGYWYSFYEALAEGGYKKVDGEGVQLVGLCAIPRKDNNGCGFIVIGKESNPVLNASILSIKDGKFVWESVSETPVYLLDAKEDEIYAPAPFIGGGYGLGFRHLESRGVWYRPLFWPWKQGEVQGFDAARKAAEMESSKRQIAEEELQRLRAKWSHAADRVSQWDMPAYEKRFFEIDKLQDWCNDDKPKRYGKFEELCREAIGMKIEPAIWHYNLACALSVQGKTDEAFEALEQAIVAGYFESDKAKKDSDFDNISSTGRFAELLSAMDAWDGGIWNVPKESAPISNGTVVVSEDNVYYAFNNHYYDIEVDSPRDTLFYMARDGEYDAIDDTVVVKFDAEGREKKRDIGFANLAIGGRPLIARGACRDGLMPFDDPGTLSASFCNVLGLYACDDYPDGKLIWCILYHGGPAEGRRLAEIIRDAYKAMPQSERREMLMERMFARKMTRMIHDSMKPGTDGGVINVSDIDVTKLMSSIRRISEGKGDAINGSIIKDGDDVLYTVREDEDIITVAIMFGVMPAVIRESNGLSPDACYIKPGTVLRIPGCDVD